MRCVAAANSALILSYLLSNYNLNIPAAVALLIRARHVSKFDSRTRAKQLHTNDRSQPLHIPIP